MKSTELQARDADFVARALRNLEREHSRGVEPTLRRLAVLTVFGGASAYYLSFGQAYNAVLRWLATPADQRPDAATAPARRLRIIHLGRRVLELKADNPALSVTEALTRIYMEGGAPRFYMTVQRGVLILRRNKIRERYLRNKYLEVRTI